MVLLTLFAPLTALAGPTLQCPMDQVFGALAGLAPPPHRGVLTAPPQLQAPAHRSARGGKPVYGTPYTHYANSDNFTVNWASGGSSEADAAWVAGELEVAWAAYLDAQGWPHPVSSDDYLLWVILDDSLGGSTGYTTVYTSEEYPQGYPVIYLNPAYLPYRDFFSALVTHELMHAVQFSLRGWSGSGDEPWYWEASAQWAIEPAIPDNDVYAEQSVYYAWHPEYGFDSMADYHQYGMFVFNAWLEDVGYGRGAMQDVWRLSAERPDDSWDDILAESTSTTAGALWAAFAADMGNGGLPESDLYEPVRSAGAATDGLAGTSVLLGTTYLRAPAAASISLEVGAGEAVLSGPGGASSPLEVRANDVIAVTGTSRVLAEWTLRVDAPLAGDSGSGDSAAADGEGAAGADPPADDRAGCACSGAAGAPVGGPWLLAALGLAGLGLRRGSRRRGSRRR